jgi:hypothetical protein
LGVAHWESDPDSPAKRMIFHATSEQGLTISDDPSTL